MGKKFEIVKENKKSTFFENDEYRVKLIQAGHVLRKNDIDKHWYDETKEDGEYFYAPIQNMIVTNKNTGESAQKRCYQPNPIGDLEEDLENKINFTDIFKKIDK